MNMIDIKTRADIKNIAFVTTSLRRPTLLFHLRLSSRVCMPQRSGVFTSSPGKPTPAPPSWVFQKPAGDSREVAKQLATKLEKHLAGTPQEVAIVHGEVVDAQSAVTEKNSIDLVVNGTRLWRSATCYL
jgi:hypothetical protein